MTETPKTPSEAVDIAQPSPSKPAPTETTETPIVVGDPEVVAGSTPSEKPPVAPAPLKI